jgi:UDP-N-acetylglucosamine 4,6-dehydratase
MGWCYVVVPEHPFWGTRATSHGTRADEEFYYSSDSNTEWLDVNQLRELLDKWPAEAHAGTG